MTRKLKLCYFEEEIDQNVWYLFLLERNISIFTGVALLKKKILNDCQTFLEQPPSLQNKQGQQEKKCNYTYYILYTNM